ncbi:hypothetical protein [Arcticibacter svalbardensis]|nr:hypothetical protein [Arcticibacter svalbardensis]
MIEKKTFKEQFGIPMEQSVEFIDIPLISDLKAFIDPFLIANNRNDKRVDEIYNQLKAFFVKLNHDFIVPDQRHEGLEFLDHLHEPNQYHLGYSGKNTGAGISATRAETIFDALRNNRFARADELTITNEAHNVLLLVTGIGQDIMSDTIANVCKNVFAEFTKEQCLIHGIPTSAFNNQYFDFKSGSWEKATFELPSYKGKSIILLPAKLISSPRSYANHYNYFIASNYISKDILSGKILNPLNKTLVRLLNDGTQVAIVKNIYKEYHKPKADLTDFVKTYSNSLNEFFDHAKDHYRGIEFIHLN